MKRREGQRSDDILTPREWEVLGLIREGLSNEQIAARLGISVDGVKFHVSEILGRLGVRDRLEAARWRPEEGRRVWALATPLLLLARLRPGWLSPVVAMGLGAATAAGIGLLIWGLVATSGNGTQQDRRAYFNRGGGGQGSFTTFRISGGDLPHAIVVSEVEYTLSTDGFDSAFEWNTKTDMPGPSALAKRYLVEQVEVRGDAVAPLALKPDVYVPGTPSLITVTDGEGWARPSASVGGLLDRYIELGRRDMLSERPTFAESLAVSQQTLTTRVSVDQQELADSQTEQLLAFLGDTAAVIFGVRGDLIGQRDLGGIKLRVALGADELVFIYVRPGPVADYGLLFQPKLLDSWEYVSLLDPPGYAQRAYNVSPNLDDFMVGLGFDGSEPKDILETRLLRRAEAQRDCCAIDHINVSRVGEAARVFRDLPQDAFQPDDSQRPLEPFSGDPQSVEVWFQGIDPFPEAVRPSKYMYYSADATQSQHGVLVPVEPASVYNGTLGRSNEPPFFASAVLDGLLREAAP